MAVYICGDCLYADLSYSNYKGEIKCTKRGIYVDPRSSACYRSEERPKTDSNCYLTTAVCHILGYEDDCYILNSLRKIRDNYMKYEVDCYDLLEEYDSIGPIISNCLYNDKDKEQIAVIMLEHYIIPAIEVFKQDHDKAIDIYIAMTNGLKEKYHINDTYLKNKNIVRAKKNNTINNK